MKIYPQTAPEIPTGESSIGWEAGRAGLATVPAHHPPRDSGTVSANSPGARGLRKQGLGPWRGQGSWDTISGLPSMAWPIRGRGRGRQQDGTTATRCTSGSICLPWSLPVIATSEDSVRVPRALREVATSCKSLLGQPPYCLDGDHYCFRGTGGAGAAARHDIHRRAIPSLHRNSAGLSQLPGVAPSSHQGEG